jgi:hypothetical protein
VQEKGLCISNRILSRSGRNTRAAFGCQESEQTVNGGEIHPVEDLPPLSGLQDKPGIDQRRQVMCKRRWSNPEMVTDISDAKPPFPGLHQQPKDREAGVMAKSGKRAGV